VTCDGGGLRVSYDPEIAQEAFIEHRAWSIFYLPLTDADWQAGPDGVLAQIEFHRIRQSQGFPRFQVFFLNSQRLGCALTWIER
jgi:hypothetical protein